MTTLAIAIGMYSEPTMGTGSVFYASGLLRAVAGPSMAGMERTMSG